MNQMKVRVDRVSEISVFEALQSQWDQMVSTSRSPHLCLTHEWLAAWWEAFDSRQSPVTVLVAREGERAVAAAPLQRHTTGVAGVPVQSLEFAANLHTFRFDFVLPGDGDVGPYIEAWDLCVTRAGACHDLKTAYAEDQALLSPGFALQMTMIEHLFQAPEVCIYDMLPPAVEYKLRWSREGTEQVSLRLYTRTARGRLAHLLQGRLRPLLRRSSLLRQAKRRVLGD